jgi:hypothetical protein
MNSKQPLSFHEWLKIRDPLLHEQVNESWKANAAALLMGLGSSMGLVNTQSPTPTPTPTVNQVNQQEDKPEYNLEAFKKLINTDPDSLKEICSVYNTFREGGEFYKKLLDTKYQKENNITEKEVLEVLQDLYKKIPAANIFFVKNDYEGVMEYVIVPDFMEEQENKLRYHYRLNPQQIQTYKDQQKKLNSTYHSPENKYKDNILSIKEVIPINYIRMAQINKEKFDKDYANLKNPTNDDLGFATNKEKFNKPIRMIVVTDEAMNDDQGKNTNAFATIDHKGSVIVMRKSSFIELPSKTSIGKLTPKGMSSLAHELRHTTQDVGKVPESRRYNDNLGYKHYMHDPVEMGVRIAAIKNLISSKTISDYLGNDPVSQAIKMSLPQDEKQILNLILNNDLWEKQIIQNNPKLQQKEIEQKINSIIERIKLLNSDADSLVDLYRSLNPEEKQNYMKEILQNYDKVVQNKPNYPRELNLSYPQRT